MPLLHNEVVAVNHLKQLLNRLGPSPILMVLDDVWPGSESLVEKFVIKIPGYKILMTSRSELPISASPYHLKPLNDEDAMTLFRHWACWEDLSPDIPDDILKRVCMSSACIICQTYMFIFCFERNRNKELILENFHMSIDKYTHF